MKVPTWLSRLWKRIKNIFLNIPKDLQAAIHTGVSVTENIKAFVDSPAADILTVLIPGELDDRIKIMLRKALPFILLQLKLAESCTSLSSPEQITLCAIKTIQSLTGDLKSAFLHNLSVLIAQAASDGKLSWKEGASIAEWYYQQKFKAH